MDDRIQKSEEIKEMLSNLLAEKETNELEFKSAKGGFPGSFWETFSAFANTAGGLIIFGVKEKNGLFSINPLNEDLVASFKKKFFDLQKDREKFSTKLLTDKDIFSVEVDGGYLLVFSVPRASREQRPVYVGLDSYNGTYRRDHEGDYVCDSLTVSQMFAERDSSQAKVESRILSNYSWDDIDMDSFRQYRTLFTNIKPDHPWTTLSDNELLRKLGGYRKDRVSGKEGFTVAGILMFGKTEAITDVECLPDYMVDYREIPADTSITRWTDRLYPDGTWEANLFQFYRRVLPKLHSRLPKPFILKGDERQDDSPAHEALREAFINFCVHAAYLRSPRLVVENRPNCIVLSNPGYLMISLAQYYAGGRSECRNPCLQTMFGLIGRSDKAGSGVDKIFKGWEFAKWRRPYITERSNPDVVELFLPLESLFSEEYIARLKSIYGSKVDEIEHHKLMALLLALTEQTISNSSLQNTLDMHPSDITKMLKNMCEEGYLIASGYGRGMCYSINKEYNTSSAISSATSSAISSATSSAISSATSSAISPATSPGVSVEEETMILDYCKQWRKISEICMAIGRSRYHTQNRIIKPLVKSGILEMEYPDTPTHPNQRYRSIKSIN